MSINISSEQRGVCEILREINDMAQGDGRDMKIRVLVAQAEKLSKEMSIELCKSIPEYYKRWPKNIDHALDMKRRTAPSYKFKRI